MPVSPTELTQCVRRFGPARPPLVPEPPSEGSGDEDEDAPNTRSHAQRMYRLRQRRARMRSSDENHVTAAKLSNVNGRELLLTYSGGPVCLYDIFDEPESEQRKEQITAPQTSQSKSKRRADQSHGEEDRAEPAPATRKAMASEGLEEATEEPNQTAPARKPLVLPQPRVTREALQSASDFVTSSLESNPNLTQEHGTEDSSYTPVYTAIGQEGREPSQQNADPSRQEALRASLRRSSSSSDPPDAEARQSSTSSPAPRHFEIRVGDDGNLEMELDNDREADTSREEEPDLNTEGYQALLQNLAASQSHSHGGDGAHQEDEEDEESDEPEYFEDDDISTSDDPESAEEEDNASRAVNREIPLVRPQKLYKGHRNVDTVKDVNFGGMDNLVVSGSDDGNVFIYDKETTDLIAIIKGDESVVNVMQYHPSLPIMAVSGIDNSAKILAPTTLGSPEGKVYLQRKFSRLASKEDIMRKNQDASWTSERLAMPPSILINLLNRAAAAGGEDGDDDDEGGPGRRRRIPLSALLQLAGEEDSDQDCVVM